MTFMAVEVLTREGHTERDLKNRGLLAGSRGEGFAMVAETDSRRENFDPKELRRLIALGAVVVVRPRSK